MTSRREFLQTTALGSLAIQAQAGPDKLPHRTLGKTGAKVSILVMGGGSRFLMYKDEDKALEALGRAFDAGVTYMDTAYSYGNGQSEERVGKALKGRQGIFLATKLSQRKGDEAMRVFEGSLRRLQRDRVDLVHIHGLGDEADLAAVEAPDGVLNALRKARDQKMTRFIGVSCHADPKVLQKALERHDFDVTQMALNAARAGMSSGSGGMTPNRMPSTFEELALPVARRKKMGVIAMKIFGQDKLVGQAADEKLLYYSLSLPGVTAAVVGMPKLELMDRNIALAKAFKPLPAGEMRELSTEVAGKNKAACDRFFRNHRDA